MLAFQPSLAPALAGLAALCAYIVTLAPGVTFEDSGELITAAHGLGVAHPPGYPLFTMLGHLAAQLPLGTVAWRVNLLSALCSALGTGILAAALQKTASSLWRDAPAVVTGCASIIGALTAAFAFEVWEQSVITEVYGLHFALIAAAYAWMVHWTFAPERRAGAVFPAALVIGLSLTNHPTTAVVVPVVVGYALALAPGLLRQPRAWAAATLGLSLGLLPLLYLPLASRLEPALDWGNPETWTNFVRVVTRHQYGTAEWLGLAAVPGQLRTAAALLWSQWPPVVLLLPVIGAAVLWHRHRALLGLALAWWLATGPVTAVLLGIPTNSGDEAVDAENIALMSVFFIPWYLGMAFLAGIAWAALLAQARRLALGVALAALVPAALALRNGPAADMSGHRYAEAYVASLFTVAREHSLVIAHWDPLYFPTLYYQHVMGLRPDLTVLDLPLLRRSWYIEQLQHSHPALMQAVAAPAAAFLEAVAPFEAGEPYDGDELQRRYIALINALIDRTTARGGEVYLTFDPGPEIARAARLESVGVAYRLRRPGEPLAAVPLETLPLGDFLGPAPPRERMARYLRDYLIAMLAERADLATREGDHAELQRLQRLAAALGTPNAPAR